MKLSFIQNIPRLQICLDIKHSIILYPFLFFRFSFRIRNSVLVEVAGRHGAVGSASDSRARCPGLESRSGYLLSFLLPLIQEGQLSVTGESMCT